MAGDNRLGRINNHARQPNEALMNPTPENSSRYKADAGSGLGDRAVLEPERLANDLGHHFIGAAADGAEASVTHCTLNSVLDHVTGTTVDLQTLIRNLKGCSLGQELRH